MKPKENKTGGKTPVKKLANKVRTSGTSKRVSTNTLQATSALPKDILQADTLQIVNCAVEGRQLLEVANVATQSQLANGSGSGSFRLGLPIIGAIQNATNGTVYVDSRGTFYDLKKVSIEFKNVFEDDIEVRLNTPYTYTMGAATTNARSKMRSKLLKPQEKWRVTLPINIHNTLRFPPMMQQQLTALSGKGTEVTITQNTLALCDYTVIIADAPPYTGAMATGDTASSWSKSAQVIEIQSIAKVRLQTGIMVDGTVETVQGPTLVHNGLGSLLDLLYIDPQEIIPSGSLTHPQVLSKLKDYKTIPVSATPNFTVITEGVYPYLKPVRIDAGDDGYRYCLCEVSETGDESAPVAIRSLEDYDNRIIGPGVAVKATGIGSVYNQYGWISKYNSWNLMVGDEVFYSHSGDGDVQDDAVWDKSVPLMYWNISVSKQIKDKLNFGWGDVLGCIQGSIEILKVGATVVSMFV